MLNFTNGIKSEITLHRNDQLTDRRRIRFDLLHENMALIIWADGKKFQNFVLIKNYLVISAHIYLIFSFGNEDSDMITIRRQP